jgi:hypothetical protein
LSVTWTAHNVMYSTVCRSCLLVFTSIDYEAILKRVDFVFGRANSIF